LDAQHRERKGDHFTMAAFTDNPDERRRLDWWLLEHSPVALYFRATVLETDMSWFTGQGYRVLSLRAGAYSSSTALLVALGELLSFPDYYGENLDAFYDCLSDVEVPEVGGLVLVLYDFGSFAAADRPAAQALLDICAHRSRHFLLMGRRFLVLVQSDDPRIEFDLVGATSVAWNPRERLNALRGLEKKAFGCGAAAAVLAVLGAAAMAAVAWAMSR
jgi:RNAse (barnase) inhibitor barstar